jgi:PAS domain S-box-containing protein
MTSRHDEEELLRSVAIQNAHEILLARQRADEELLRAKEALEAKAQELARSVAMMRATLEATTDGILVVDDSGRVTQFNANFVRMWRVPPEVIDAREYDRLVQFMCSEAKDPELCRAKSDEIRASSSPESIDVLELVDGRTFERFSRTQVMASRSVGRVWTFRDITERRRAEERQAKLAAIVESSDDAIISKDLNGIITTWNAGAERVFGYTAQDVIGQPITVLMPPDRVDEEAGILERLRRGKRIDHYETVRRRKDGTLLDISLTVSPIIDGSGKVVGASKVARDITERKRADALMACQKEAFEMAASDAPLARVLEFFGRGVENCLQQRAMLAIHLLDESGKRFAQTVAPSLPASYREAVEGSEVASASGPCRAAVASRRRAAIADVAASNEFPAFAAFALPLGIGSGWSQPILSSAGKVLGTIDAYYRAPREAYQQGDFVGDIMARTASVIIERKLAEEERKQLLESERWARTEAERMTRLKDEFLATLSHELRTPLGAIVGWSQVLKRPKVPEADLQSGLDIIERNARVQARLIDDLLDMSRIESGKLRLDIQPVDAVSIIEGALQTVTPAAEAKGIRLERMLDPAAGPISGDPGRLQQVMWNLLSNAIKFTPKDGTVQIALNRAGSSIRIAVTDTGIGITPEFLPHVFERFRQADTSTTRRCGGLGLGLSIAKHLIELHGGTLTVSSPGEGLGTTFTMHLPPSPVRTHEAPQPERAGPDFAGYEAPELSGIKVLVVDDQADARELIRRVLAECGAEVLTAGTAGEALVLAARDRPDLAVTDIGMPDVDGYELVKQIRALAAGARIPVIALTALARPEDRRRALRAGFLAHLAKPVDPSELVATIASIASRTGSG